MQYFDYVYSKVINDQETSSVISALRRGETFIMNEQQEIWHYRKLDSRKKVFYSGLCCHLCFLIDERLVQLVLVINCLFILKFPLLYILVIPSFF